MNLDVERSKYTNKFFELIGKTIKAVSYFQIDSGEPTFDFEDHHSLDYGLQLETDDGVFFYMIWDSQYFQYDLKFKKGKLIEELNPESNIKCYNMTLSEYWTDRIGQKIKDVKSYWSYFKTDGEQNKTYYPQDIELIFHNGLNVIVSAIEIRPNGQVYGMSDHISVFFDSEIAVKYGAKNKIN